MNPPPAPKLAKTPHLHFALTFFLYGPVGTGILLLVATVGKISGMPAVVFALAAVGPFVTLIAWAVTAHRCRRESDNRKRIYADQLAQYHGAIAYRANNERNLP